jgi:hypothetical protein
MAVENLSDESLLTLYENIRQQVSEDICLGSRHRLMGETAKEYAERLREEIGRRRLRVIPIIWK